MQSRQYDRRPLRRDLIPPYGPLRYPTPVANPSAMSDTSNTIARLDELEIRIAHQDQTIEDLNAAITAQWKLIERLEARVERLGERVADSEQSAGEADPVNRPPPHY